ncbi:MAG: hypothetical protein ACLS4Z_07995 [Christensenellaceae bacterium]
MASDLKEVGAFFAQQRMDERRSLEKSFRENEKYSCEKHAKLYVIDAIKIGESDRAARPPPFCSRRSSASTADHAYESEIPRIKHGRRADEIHGVQVLLQKATPSSR